MSELYLGYLFSSSFMKQMEHERNEDSELEANNIAQSLLAGKIHTVKFGGKEYEFELLPNRTLNISSMGSQVDSLKYHEPSNELPQGGYNLLDTRSEWVFTNKELLPLANILHKARGKTSDVVWNISEKISDALKQEGEKDIDDDSHDNNIG